MARVTTPTFLVEATINNLDILRFKDGVLPRKITVRQASDSWVGVNQALEFAIAGTGDKITFDAFSYQGHPTVEVGRTGAMPAQHSPSSVKPRQKCH